MKSRVERGRGATYNPAGRFEKQVRDDYDDGWGTIDEELPPLETMVFAERAKTIITRNDSPDIGFDQSINPYRGCEHGCIYCYARPAHAYMDLSPGLDFETKLFYKADAAKLLDQELRKPGYRVSPIHIGGNTDGYQPIERKLRVTRSVMEVLQRFRHPFTIITKSAMIERDLDIFEDMARDNLVSAAVSVTSMSAELKRTLEPRTASAGARLRAIRRLSEVGVPVTVMVAPVIPFVNDADLESVLEAAAEAGASSAGYVYLRLPHEVKELFRAWLDEHHPLRAEHVMSLVRAASGGKDYDSRFGVRQRGQGEHAQMIGQRFALACKRLGLNQDRRELDTSRFCVPPAAGDQLGLF